MTPADRLALEETPVKVARPLPDVSGNGAAGGHGSGGRGPAPAPRRCAAACLLLAFVVVFGATARAATRESAEAPPEYIFHLRNGSQVQTAAYWEEGNEYRLERFGGVIGLNKSDVVRIERVQPGAARAPAPAASPFPLGPEPGQEPPQGIISTISTYVAEMVEWMRAWMARLWTPRRTETAPPVAQGGQAPGRPPQPRDTRPPLFVLLAVVVAVPILLFGGKRLGGWLFSETLS